jgi:intracellular septation protein
MKPTIVNALIAITLFVGLYFKKNFLAILFGSAFSLTEVGWRGLTIRYALFSIVLAVLNECVWRTQTTDFWVAFKVWGIMPLTAVFMMTQIPFLMKHSDKAE